MKTFSRIIKKVLNFKLIAMSAMENLLKFKFDLKNKKI